MNPQEKILDDICKVSKQLIQSKINPLIDQLVITKINQETEKFFESVNIFGDIFPKPEGSVLFRFCGSCCKCKWDGPFYQGISYSHEQWKKECESVYRSPIYKHETYDTDIYTDEYILLCSFSPVNNDWKTLYTNYGRLCSINHQFTHIYTPSTQMNMCVMDYTDGCGRNKPILSDKIKATPSDFASSTVELQPSNKDGFITAIEFIIRDTTSEYGTMPKLTKLLEIPYSLTLLTRLEK